MEMKFAPAAVQPFRIKRLNDLAILPTKGSEQSAGWDLYAAILNKEIAILPGQTAKIGTGLSIELPIGTFGAVFARSGLATKQGLRPANCVGVCDSDYRGEYIVALHNDSNKIRIVRNGDRIAQLVIIPYVICDYEEVIELTETERGEGGFGSTGI